MKIFDNKRGCGGATAPHRGSACARFLFAFALAALGLGGISISGCGGSNITANNNVTSITISPTSAQLSPGEQQDFSAQVMLADSSITTNTNVTWQVNGTNGGNTATGTIVASSVDANVGVYTAPAVVPSTNVTITAIITEQGSSSTSTKTITSNVATVSFGGVAGLSITPALATVGAGGHQQFEAMLNNAQDSNATYSISSTAGGNIGTIGAITGVYTAPDVPPPGGKVTVTATDGTQTATATATIVYSNVSLLGPFAFSYTGNNSTGFIAVAGRFDTDGNGNISGIEDVRDFGTFTPFTANILKNGSSYTVGKDGRGTAVLQTDHGVETWAFVLSAAQHAVLTRFDGSVTGSGTIDQQNVNDINGDPTQVITGPYVFSASGGDSTFKPMAVAGRFAADGAGGTAQAPAIVDVNDNGAVKTADTSLTGSYQFDGNNPGTGRGTMTLSSTSTGQLQFAFYVIDNTHLHIVEIDSVNYLAGDVYSELAGPSYTTSALAAGTYGFTTGGNSSAGAYAAGGIFTPDGNGNITGGVLDTNNAGTPTANTSLAASAYSVDPATGRMNLGLGSTMAFAAYPTAANTVVMLELDSTAITSGLAYQQQGTPAALSGSFALGLSGQGVFYNSSGSYQPNAQGQAVLTGSAVSSGNLDINSFGTAPQPSDPISNTSTLAAPGSNGRSTATLVATDPPATFNLIYYWISPSTALVVGQDKTRVLTGVMLLQF